MSSLTAVTAVSGSTAVTAVSGQTAVTAVSAQTAVTAVTAVQGTQPVAGLHDPATTAGLLFARDGIVGPWAGATLQPRDRGTADPENLADWTQTIRLSVIGADVTSRLAFVPGTGPDAADGTGKTATPHVSVLLRGPIRTDQGGVVSSFERLATFDKPHRDVFVAQLEKVRDFADLRGDRMAEIVSQAGLPLPYLTSIAGLSPGRARFAHELLALTQGIATHVVLSVKHALACQRPDAHSAQIQPVIPVPGHATLPSGHATESFAVALVLARLVGTHGATTAMLMRQATRIAVRHQCSKSACSRHRSHKL